MDRTAEGEYELVVGNRHLLSVVFILIVLFGIFFTLGYFVGRNSADMVAAQPQPQPRAGGVTQPREVPPQTATPSAEQPIAPGEAKVSGGTVPVTPATGADAPAASQPKPEPPAPQQPASAKEIAGSPAPGETYLQVAAVKRGVAEGIADVLKQKGFRAVVAPVIVNGVTSAELFRVLVGPVSDASDLAKTRSDIEAAGMGRPIVRKY